MVAERADYWRRRTSASADRGPSLPSLSPDPAQGYFAAGITDEIRGQLSQVGSLRLLSRNGLDGYKDDVTRAVRELGVRNFVDGSIRVEGNRVRVSAELVDASNQQTVWSNQYDRDLADVLTVQSDIAQQIVRSLHASLSPREQTRLAKRPTENLEAYKLALQANQLNTFDRVQNLEAIAMYHKALALDPKYAEAQSGMAYRLIMMGQYDDPANIDKGIAEAQAAVRMDPLLPFAHFTLATAYALQGRDAQSRESFQRTLELNPNYATAMSILRYWTHGTAGSTRRPTRDAGGSAFRESAPSTSIT